MCCGSGGGEMQLQRYNGHSHLVQLLRNRTKHETERDSWVSSSGCVGMQIIGASGAMWQPL